MGGWVEGDTGAWDGRMSRGRWGALQMGGWVVGDGGAWDGRMGRGRWGCLGWEDG